MKSNWCLFTAYDRSFTKVAERTVPTMRRYAERYGMDFAEHPDWRPQPASWAKLILADQKFAQGYEYIFWVDADAAIRRFDEDIRDQIDDTHDLYFSFEDETPNLLPSKTRLNAGVFVWRNSPRTHRFIEAVQLEKRRFLEHKWWDQAAMIAVMGLWSHFDDANHRPDEPTEMFDWVKRLPGRWNNSMGIRADADAIIRHFIAMDERGKLLGLALDELIGPRDQEKDERFRRILIGQLWPLTMRSIHRSTQSRRPAEERPSKREHSLLKWLKR